MGLVSPRLPGCERTRDTRGERRSFAREEIAPVFNLEVEAVSGRGPSCWVN
jgi:hypothetical protein